MQEVAARHAKQLGRIKENVKGAYTYFKHNVDRYNEFRRFLFETCLTDSNINLLESLSKPSIEFNVAEAYVSRLLGEFSKQEPSIEVSASDKDSADPELIRYIEQHMRHKIMDTKTSSAKYECYKDLLSGGFSVLKVWTEYKHSMSFDQDINFGRAFDPTLCGFDETARLPHKGDGKFCFELFPMEQERFEEQYPDVSLKDVSFNKSFGGFNWSYVSGVKKIVLVCDYYEKKLKRVKIVQTTDNEVMTKEDYEKKIKKWKDLVEQPPGIVGKPRETVIENIVRYRLFENKVIEYEETDYRYLPLVFVDGNSAMLQINNAGSVYQFTRPYIYHAKGIQQLINFAGISVANDIENVVQHKFMVAKEALPKEQEFLEAYTDVQKANVLVYNSFFEQDPNQPIPNPIREIGKPPSPPEAFQMFTGGSNLMQTVLGSYDASLGINNNQLSGVAIVEGATQSNSTAMPYIVGFLDGLQRCAEIILDLVPKYYTTPRSIPVMTPEGKRSYVKINQQGGLPIANSYQHNELNVEVTAGVNFQIQKSKALQQLISLMGASQEFNQFMNQKGLPILLDNIEIRGIDQIKELAEEWQQEMDQMKQQQMAMQQQNMQNNPAVMKNQIETQKLQQNAIKNSHQFAVDMAKIKQDQIKVMSDIQQTNQENQVQLVKANTEQFSKQVDLKLKQNEQKHKHFKEMAELHHKVVSKDDPNEDME